MSSFKNELYYLGNGWGWFVSTDTYKPEEIIQAISYSSRKSKLKTIKSIRSMKSVANLSNLHKDYEYDTKMENDDTYCMWGVNAACILSVIVFGFIII